MILPKTTLRTFLRTSQCADSVWLVIDDFYKVHQKPASVDGINVGIKATRHWIPTVKADFSYCRLTLLHSSHFCFFRGHGFRVNIPDLHFTKDNIALLNPKLMSLVRWHQALRSQPRHLSEWQNLNLILRCCFWGHVYPHYTTTTSSWPCHLFNSFLKNAPINCKAVKWNSKKAASRKIIKTI